MREQPHQHDQPTEGGLGRLVGVPPARPTLALPPGSTSAEGASRVSRIRPGTVVLHGDLHNHTLISDGYGDPASAFASMREAGLDVAALTDHVHFADDVRAGLGGGGHSEPALARYAGRPRGGLTAEGWQHTAALADAHDAPGIFTAIRGFEWTEPWTGHVNVWHTPGYTPVREAGRMDELFAWLIDQQGQDGDGSHGSRASAGSAAPHASAAPHGSHGLAGLAGYNHPGREPGRFSEFHFVPQARDQLVSLEIFNRYDDYLFEGYGVGSTSPLVACLEAGWRPGLIGVTDEHGDDWGYPEGKGRAGIWVHSHTRAGVHEALMARRVFATRVAGLRLDATANGMRMGSTLRHRRGPVRFEVDLDRGQSWSGRELEIQVLRPDTPVPAVIDVGICHAGEPATLTVPIDYDDGGWVVLRLADPEALNTSPGPDGHPANNAAIAYTSPWYLEADPPG